MYACIACVCCVQCNERHRVCVFDAIKLLLLLIFIVYTNENEEGNKRE